MEKFVLATRRFIRDEEAVTAIEYGLIAALIAVVIILALTNTGTALKDVYLKVADCLKSPTGALCPK